MSSIQQGIQAAHCLAEMFYEYVTCEKSHHLDDVNTKAYNMLMDWTQNHKTMILLNGGYSENLRLIWKLLATPLNPYPCGKFHESNQALDGALTCVGIILPERIYNNVDFVKALDSEDDLGVYNSLLRELSKDQLTDFEMDLCRELSKYGLAK